MAPRLNIPPVTRGLLVLVVTLSFLYNLARWKHFAATPPSDSTAQSQVPYLALVPAVSIFNPWTFLTATFVEQNVITLLVNGATIFFGGKYLERAWGSKEFGKVVLIASLVPNLIVVPIYVAWGAVMGDTTRALTPITGGITLQATFLVAFKQLVPEHTVTILKGLVKMRVKHFPALFLLLNSISGLVFGTDTAAVLSWVGLLTAWTYLRFYKTQPDMSGSTTGGRGLKGDASETFAFVMFFPDVMQPPIALVCDQIYILLTNLKICTPFSNEDIASGNEQAAARGEAGLPHLLNNGARGGRGSGKREEAERRRALALKALDQRLSAASSSKNAPQPVQVIPAPSQGQAMLGGTDYAPDEGR
jgi:membrane associated rhomboid family serine protease